jgi:stage III sporulation protein SpoIIIAA
VVGNEPFQQELQLLIDVLPPRLQQAIDQKIDPSRLIDVMLDYGRPAVAHVRKKQLIELDPTPVTLEEMQYICDRIGPFTSDNRAGIPKTLHRISCMRNRQAEIVGLTCRVGRVITGTIEPIREFVQSGKSILMLGPPGVGKTTKLREVAKMMADEMGLRVVIVDTANEIAGDGDIPHPAVGRARRMQVPSPDAQKDVMIEAVQNHTPEVIVVDEIGTEEEAMAARTIAERGVVLIATAHGHSLESLIKNPTLSDLIGGIQTVTLGDDEAKRRASQKTVLEREKRPTFDIAIEIQDHNTVAIYPDVAEAVDQLLRGWRLFPEVRKVDATTGTMRVLKGQLQGQLTLNVDGPAPSPDATRSAPNVYPGDPLNEPKLAKAKEPRDPLTTDYRAMVSPAKGVVEDLSEPPIRLHTPTHLLPDSPKDAPRKHSGESNLFRVFLYGLNPVLLDQIIKRLHLTQVMQTHQVHDAQAVIAMRSEVRPGSKVAKLAQDYEIPVFYAKSNTMPQIQRALREAMQQETGTFAAMAEASLQNPFEPSSSGGDEDETKAALMEVQQAIEAVQKQNAPVELAPRRSYIRRLQHTMVERQNLKSKSVGAEPNRRLKIFPASER